MALLLVTSNTIVLGAYSASFSGVLCAEVRIHFHAIKQCFPTYYVVFTLMLLFNSIQGSTSSRLLPDSSYSCCNLHVLVYLHLRHLSATAYGSHSCNEL
jgi:hypothetical protein